MPVQPTAHYAMGGLPTDVDGRVVVDEQNTPLPGLYAAGECACVSVHGANRLGTNSLVDIIVFGRRGGKHIARFVDEVDLPPLPPEPTAVAREEVDRLRASRGNENVGELRKTLQEQMMNLAGVFRSADHLQAMSETLAELRDRYARVTVKDQGARFNTDVMEALEFGYLLDISENIVSAALARTESRGGHYREDFPQRDDARWLKHTLAFRTAKGIALRYKPVVITRFQPQERKY
jgi:succinate dehydrogenase / fumarate reductase flavoprotein subunit